MSLTPATRSIDPRFFPGLSARARTALSKIGRRRRFEDGSTLQNEGMACDRIFFILEGQAKMCRMTPAGKNLILSLLGSGDLFGIANALSGRPCFATVVALGRVELLTLGRSDLFSLLSRSPELVPDILPALTEHVRECSHCLIESSCSKVEIRFAHLFRDFGERHGEFRGASVFVPVSLSRQDLADLTGTTIETAIRIMSRWGREEVVTTEKDGFTIHDALYLENLCME